jgi:hypothetical protein
MTDAELLADLLGRLNALGSPVKRLKVHDELTWACLHASTATERGQMAFQMMAMGATQGEDMTLAMYLPDDHRIDIPEGAKTSAISLGGGGAVENVSDVSLEYYRDKTDGTWRAKLEARSGRRKGREPWRCEMLLEADPTDELHFSGPLKKLDGRRVDGVLHLWLNPDGSPHKGGIEWLSGEGVEHCTLAND